MSAACAAGPPSGRDGRPGEQPGSTPRCSRHVWAWRRRPCVYSPSSSGFEGERGGRLRFVAGQILHRVLGEGDMVGVPGGEVGLWLPDHPPVLGVVAHLARRQTAGLSEHRHPVGLHFLRPKRLREGEDQARAASRHQRAGGREVRRDRRGQPVGDAGPPRPGKDVNGDVEERIQEPRRRRGRFRQAVVGDVLGDQNRGHHRRLRRARCPRDRAPRSRR